MRKTLPLFIIILCSFFSNIYGQVPEDALRYSWYPSNGTARNLAIGGAMGSLGGDLTATFTNPAGLGFYKTREMLLTAGGLSNQLRADYRGKTANSQKGSFMLGPTGVIFGFGDNSKKTSSAISIAFMQTVNFNNTLHYSGYNDYSSFSEQFAEEFSRSGKSIDAVLNTNSSNPYTAAPALYTYLIDTATINGALRVVAAPEYLLDQGQALRQDFMRKTSGGMYELAAGFAFNDNKKFLFGATFGLPIVSFKSNTTFTEQDTSSNMNNKFSSFTYNDNFKSEGIGFNLRVGGIYRPKEYFRIGLAITTPSFMSLKDTRTTSLSTVLESDSGTIENYSVSSTQFTNNQPGESEYVQLFPWKAVLSASYVFREVENVKKQRAFVTADVEYVNNRNSRFHSDNPEPSSEEKSYFTSLNKVVKKEYKGSFNFKVGGELKFNTIMGRLGFAYYTNPYKDKELKANKMLLSGGLGYRDKGFFIDLTYVYSVAKDVTFPYRLADRANTFATTRQQQGMIMATIGTKF